jgi:hypothetical protein
MKGRKHSTSVDLNAMKGGEQSIGLKLLKMKGRKQSTSVNLIAMKGGKQSAGL